MLYAPTQHTSLSSDSLQALYLRPPYKLSLSHTDSTPLSFEFHPLMAMATTSFILFFSSSILILLNFQHAEAATILVDGVSEWKDPIAHIGDTIIFQHKFHYKLYIFKNANAFSFCNFSQATLLSKPNSTSFTWKPSRPGNFYFSFNNGSALPCTQGQKLSVKVPTFALPPITIISTNAPELSPTSSPSPISGGMVSSSPAPVSSGIISSSPANQFPTLPTQSASSPSPASSPSSLLPDKGGSTSIPFINSNPAVPLPTGEVDSATIRPLSTSGYAPNQVVGFLVPLCFLAILMMML